jgi:hypothetical protein
MLDYREYVKQVIARRDYQLDQLEERIDKLWLDGKLSEDDRAELLQSAADNARDALQIDIAAKFAEIETRLYNLEFPVDQYPEYQKGQVSEKGVVYRADVTGDGELDLVRYDGGRASTSLSIGKIEGWHLLDRELNPTHDISRDADGGYVLAPVEGDEEQPEE